MPHKSPVSPYSIPGQRPPLDPDSHTVAVPRMADELNGKSVQDQRDGKPKRKH